MNNNYEPRPTVTMFVPYDCNNNCPFCVNKKDYADQSDFSLERCFKSLSLLDSIYPDNDIVLTGGEPLAELDTFQQMINHISDRHDIYVNTTLPTDPKNDIYKVAEVLNKNKDKITCVNVSRHLKSYVEECTDDVFDLLKVRHRINCVVFDKCNEKELVDFLTRFDSHEIQLRANYSNLTLDNVFEIANDDLFKMISSIATYEEPLDKELFRTGYVFHYKNSRITYHKTLPYSKIENHIGDIIIRQNGLIYDDWNEYGHPLNINDLIN